MFVQCKPGTEGSDCGFPNGASVTVGPSTFHGTYSDQVQGVTAIPDCKLTGSRSVRSAYCEQTMIGPQGFLEAPVSTTDNPSRDDLGEVGQISGFLLTIDRDLRSR